MAQELSIYVHTGAQSPASAFVKSEVYPTQTPEVFDFVFGDQVNLNVFLVDGAGGFDAISGLGTHTLRVAIGTPGGTPAALQDTWSTITDGWEALLDLNTTGIQSLLAGEASVNTHVEVEVTDGSGNKRTYGQRKIRVLNQTIGSAAVSPTPTSSFYTKVETNAKFVQNQSSLTGLTGGTATDLDSLTTSGIAVGPIVAVVLSDVLSYYQLQTGTDAESSPDIIRPDDYAASTNEKIWQLVKQDITGYTHTQSSPSNSWTVSHSLGYHPSGITIYDASGDGAGIIGADVVHTDVNTLTIGFRGNQTGKVKVI